MILEILAVILTGFTDLSDGLTGSRSSNGNYYYYYYRTNYYYGSYYSSSLPIPLIVGAVIGGFSLLAVIIAVVCCCIKSKGHTGRVLTATTPTVSYINTSVQSQTSTIPPTPTYYPGPPPAYNEVNSIATAPYPPPENQPNQYSSVEPQYPPVESKYPPVEPQYPPMPQPDLPKKE